MHPDDVTDKAASLQQKYIQLLEERISQLESVIKKDESKKTADAEEDESEEENKGDGKEAEESAGKKDGNKPSSRYVTALRSYDRHSATFKDQIVAETATKREEAPKNIAYIFRRVVYDTSGRGELAYSQIEVEDPELIKVLKVAIGPKYPGVNFDGDKVFMQAPFPAIVHNWDKLQDRAKQDPDSQTRKDLAHLLDRLEHSDELRDYFKTRTANMAGDVVNFDTMWTIFAPKTLVVVKPFMGAPQILQVSLAPIPTRFEPKNAPLLMDAWCWDWNGKEMVKVTYKLEFKRFTGTSAIRELDVYPLEYHQGEAELRTQIKERAVAFLEATKFCKEGAGQMFTYSGNAFVAGKKIVSGNKRDRDDDYDDRRDRDDDGDDGSHSKIVPIEGEIISDARAYLQYGNSSRSHPLGQMVHDRIEEEAGDVEEVFGTLTEKNVKEHIEASKDEFLTIPCRVLGYATKEKVWGQFLVTDMKPPKGRNKTKFVKDLQLRQDYKDLIMALVESHEEKRENDRQKQVEDIVDKKGKGLVLLFHGPPGVGKTLTAETIAEATGKPLFVVSVAEIGLDASRAEQNLEKLFNLATRWEAVLLVDEADVFLETRGSTSDASRNALVSVLLRVLEYYRGIIILTTNRIKSMDVAVISRIHLAIRYEDLDEKMMKDIFSYFLNPLEPELIQNRDEINDFINKTGHHYQLNGRQIRNVVSSALAVARQKRREGTSDGRLTEAELRKVCEMTRDFQEQLKENINEHRYANEAGYGYRRR